MKLQRWDPPNSCTKMSAWIPCDDGDYCFADDVARLEASHADLLAAAKELVGFWDTPIAIDPFSRIDRLRAAIAKAEHSEDEPITDDEGDA